jgi:hypothetical protein
LIIAKRPRRYALLCGASNITAPTHATKVLLLHPRDEQKFFTLLDLCVSSLRRGHANLLCIVPILTDDPRRESNEECRKTTLKIQDCAAIQIALSCPSHDCADPIQVPAYVPRPAGEYRSHFGSRYPLGPMRSRRPCFYYIGSNPAAAEGGL